MADYFLKGFVGAIPTIKEINGNRLAEFIISINVGKVDKAERTWIKCSAWRDMADLVKKHIFQGDLLGINGRIMDIQAWIDPKSKKAKASVEIHADEIFKSTVPGKFENIRKLNGGHERLSGHAQPSDDPFNPA